MVWVVLGGLEANEYDPAAGDGSSETGGGDGGGRYDAFPPRAPSGTVAWFLRAVVG